MAKQKLWIKIVTLGLAHIFGILEVNHTEQGIQIKRLLGTKTINNSRINSIDNNLLSVKIDLASGKGNEAPIIFSKVFMSGLDDLANNASFN